MFLCAGSHEDEAHGSGCQAVARKNGIRYELPQHATYIVGGENLELAWPYRGMRLPFRTAIEFNTLSGRAT